ncbi:DUF2589 domain-containing protein [Pectobacterium wasabiae]|uniref:DUF2589 domain-containing protein n=1 Tax=Pectobacterium wasabiae TaxID=55208 RepID=A0AAW3EMM4_9GAMM|nr:DUF2589 domain-containing protein [Pectobacterium wasabiae]AOR64598.1 hypothetical protein A7983_15330 [Pectobacterium wasabiae CFBP 3304]EJS93355.1 Hypothetical protein Y17_3378 [Pectobacterium wasabiae CFBP 3304]KFX08909.1 hypothetical protein JV38_04225 [Pectobacterium wasabiae]KGA29016.1 hypothetical protein KU73_07950 [Pectobacterium wasabiae]
MPMKDWFRSSRGAEPKADSPPSPPQPEESTRLPPVDPPQDPPLPPGDGTPPSGSGGIPVTLADITRGMQHAASAANQLIAHQYMQALDPFFEHSDDGRLVPKIIEMELDEQHYFKLPLVALSTPRGLMLEKMKVFLTVRADDVEQKSALSGTSDDAVSRFHVSMSPPSREVSGRDSGHVDIEMQFTVLEPPESVMRLIEEYTRLVLPQAIDRSDNNG